MSPSKKNKEYYWRSFETQSDLVQAIRQIIDAKILKEEFISELISDLIFERHWYCAPHKLRSLKFRKLPFKGTYLFQGFFEECSPNWHPVSWRECISPKSADDIIRDAFRQGIEDIISRYKAEHRICERCNVLSSEEVDHVQPTFQEISTNAICLLNEEDKNQIMLMQDWDNPNPFTLSSDNKAMEAVRRIHKTAILQAVCKDCHRKNARDRKERATQR